MSDAGVAYLMGRPCVFDLSVSGATPPRLEGLGPLKKKQKQTHLEGPPPLKTQNKRPANRTRRAAVANPKSQNERGRNQPHCRLLSRISDVSNGIPWDLNRGPSLLYSVPGLSVAWSSEPTVGVARNLHLSGDHYDQLFELKCGGLVGHVSDPQKRWLTNRPFRHQ